MDEYKKMAKKKGKKVMKKTHKKAMPKGKMMKIHAKAHDGKKAHHKMTAAC